jgi:hypothetical protein
MLTEPNKAILQAQTQYDSIQQALAELKAREAALKHSLIQANLALQFYRRGVTRPEPVGFVAGGWDKTSIAY